jgi:uncharacterized protein involved in exopolysaccharide biosynthesis
MREYFETFFRHKWLFWLPFLIVLAVAIAGGVYSSWQYESRASLWTEPNLVLGETASTLTAAAQDTSANQSEFARLDALLQTDEFIGTIVDRVPKLRADANTPEGRLSTIATVRRNLNVWPWQQNLLMFRYRGRDAEVAQQVVSNTVGLFLAQRLQDRVGQADSTIAFLQTQQQEYQGKLATASTALSQFETAHPPASRATMSDLEQLQYQQLKTDYETILDHLRYLGGELDKAAFSKDKFIAQHASTYVVKDPPLAPQSPDLSVNKLATIVLVGLAVAVALGFSVVALATWFGGRRPVERTALPAWLDRALMTEEPTT